MALIRGIHLLAHGNRTEAGRIAEDIRRYERLLVGTTAFYGAGSYAWYVDSLPDDLRSWPAVLFEIDEALIVPVCTRAGVPLGFFRIPGPIGSYVPLHVLTFLNLGEDHTEVV